MLNVHIPFDGFFTVFARGALKGKASAGDLGTFIRLEGVVIVYYTYPRHRRAYIIQNIDETKHYSAERLPEVKQPVAVIYKAKGRRIDLLRRLSWNLLDMHGDAVFGWGTVFWQKIGCLLDAWNGKVTATRRSNLIGLCSRHCQLRKMDGHN
jgi:hypothetical protein